MAVTTLTFKDGVKKMKDLCEKVTDGKQHKFTVFPNLEVCYPGGKKAGDYVFTVSGKVLKHSSTCVIVASYVLNGTLTYDEALDLLEDVYKNGWRDDDSETSQIRFLKAVLFWTTLQEEINYPQPRYQGRAMSFKRYAEAVLSTRMDSPLGLDDVMRRSDNYKVAWNNPITFPDAPSFY